MDKQIIIVEDEKPIADLLRDYFQREHDRVTVLYTGDELISLVRSTLPDLLILDVMLPGRDGFSLCKEIRTFSSVPIMLLTARVEETDRLTGLGIGADDYVCKPFSPREVVARAKAILRRSEPEQVQKTMTIGEITLDSEKFLVFVSGHEVDLTKSEFELLRTFMKSPRRVFSRSDLVVHMHGYSFEGYERTVDSHIKNLRKKLAAYPGGQDVIGTVYGMGYRFEKE